MITPSDYAQQQEWHDGEPPPGVIRQTLDRAEPLVAINEPVEGASFPLDDKDIVRVWRRKPNEGYEFCVPRPA